MRILHFINNINLSWYSMLTDTLDAQMARGNEIHVVFPPPGVNYQKMKKDGYPVTPLPVRSSKLDYIASMKLSKMIKEQKFDILHTHLTSSALLGSAAARWAGAPCVASVLKMTNKRHYMRCDKLLPCSGAVMADLKSQGVPDSLMELVYTGINIDAFMKGFDTPPTAREEYGFSPEHKVLSIVARLAPMKGHSVLLDAMPAVFERHPDARLLIVGDGELQPGLEEQAKRLKLTDRVVFAGARYDLQNILASADYSVMSSVDKEGLPISLVQSVLGGKPVVMTDVAGIREIVRDGETGYLAPPGDSAALARAMCQMLDDPAEAKRRADRAREFVMREFDVNYTAEKLDRIYSELLERKG